MESFFKKKRKEKQETGSGLFIYFVFHNFRGKYSCFHYAGRLFILFWQDGAECSSSSSIFSLLTTENQLARSLLPSLGSASRRPILTTSVASGWPWPRLLASRANLDFIYHDSERLPPPMLEANACTWGWRYLVFSCTGTNTHLWIFSFMLRT